MRSNLYMGDRRTCRDHLIDEGGGGGMPASKQASYKYQYIMLNGVAGVDGAGGAGQVKLRAAAFQQRIQQQDEEARRMEDVKRWEERD